MTHRNMLFVIVLLIIMNLQVQGQVQFGLKGGVNLSNFIAHTEQGIVPNFLNRISFHVGFFTEIPLNKFLSIRPEMLLSAKGAHHEFYQENYYYFANYERRYSTETCKVRIDPYYIEVPIYLKAGFDAGIIGKFAVGIGLYLACGISGKAESEYRYEFSETNWYEGDSNVMKMFTKGDFDKAPFKRLDMGISIFMGYELNMGVFATVGYDMGLRNVINGFDGEKLYNRTFYISTGYKF